MVERFYIRVNGKNVVLCTREEVQRLLVQSPGAYLEFSNDGVVWKPLIPGQQRRYLPGFLQSTPPTRPSSRRPPPLVRPSANCVSSVAARTSGVQVSLDQEKTGRGPTVSLSGSLLVGGSVLTAILVLVFLIGLMIQGARSPTATGPSSTVAQEARPGDAGKTHPEEISAGHEPKAPREPQLHDAPGVDEKQENPAPHREEKKQTAYESPPELPPEPGAVAPPEPARTTRPDFAVLEQATVTIRTDRGLGSGFFIEHPKIEYLVVTNHHVVANSRYVLVQLEKNLYEVHRWKLFPECDLAFLAPDIKSNMRVTKLSLRASPPMRGEDTIAFGSPLGLLGTLTKGCISGVVTTSQISESLGSPFPFGEKVVWVQHTAPINPGNSGGPLVDNQCQVIGVNTLAVGRTPDGRLIQNLNFALAAQEVASRLQNVDTESLVSRTSPDISRRPHRTVEFWLAMKAAMQGLSDVVRSLERFNDGSSEGSAAGLFTFVLVVGATREYLNNLDGTGVDREALQCRSALVTFLEKTLEGIQKLLEAAEVRNRIRQERMLREIAAEIEAEGQKCGELLETVRYSLSKKYGVDFPAIPL